MPRSGEAARERLRDAALALYRDQGYEQTTTAEIAARAGVNHRTFFRHFPDKREVLFMGEKELHDALVHALSEAPSTLAPLAALMTAFIASAHVLEDNRESGITRLRLIAETPALRERDLAKGAMLTESLSQGLAQRGESPRVAGVAAAVGWATFHEAASNWIADSDTPLEQHLRSAFSTLADLASSHELVTTPLP